MNTLYLNGKYLPSKKGFISVNDIGFLRNYGVFDYLRTYNGRPFLLKEHLARFRNSAKSLGLYVPKTDQQIAAIISKLLNKNHLAEASIRMVLSGGELVGALEYDQGNPTFAVIVKPYHDLPKDLYEKGVKLVTYEHQRIFPEAKTLNYLTAVKLQPWCKKEKAFEVLYTYKGQVLECTTSNFFGIVKNTIVTPKKNVLSGTVRNFIVDLARKKFKVVERPVRVSEISKFSESFITGTNKEVLPVVMIDRQKIGNGKVGPMAKQLREIFRDVACKN